VRAIKSIEGLTAYVYVPTDGGSGQGIILEAEPTD
jgi:hypothetical protein